MPWGKAMAGFSLGFDGIVGIPNTFGFRMKADRYGGGGGVGSAWVTSVNSLGTARYGLAGCGTTGATEIWS